MVLKKKKKQISLKKAIMSVQSDFKDKMISVEYISKKGKEMCHSIFIPIGRKIKQALLQERRREALKKRMPAVSRKGDSLSTGHISFLYNNYFTLIKYNGTCFANSILIARVRWCNCITPISTQFHHVQTM